MSTLDTDNEIISIRQIADFVWRTKQLLIAITLAFAAAAVVWVLQMEDEYTSEVILVPNETETGSANNLGGSIGGLASLAGINLNASSGNKVNVALEMMQSRGFIMRVIDKHDLLPLLLAAESWNRETGEIAYNHQIFEPDSQKWTREPPPGKSRIPSAWEGYQPFKNALSVEHDTKTGIVKVSFTHVAPSVAKQMITVLVAEVNGLMRKDAVEEAEQGIAYLQSAVEQIELAEVKTTVYSLIEEQIKNLMLAKVREQYVFKMLAEPLLPEEKSGPKRAIICIIVTFFGFLVALFSAIFYDGLKTSAPG